MLTETYTFKTDIKLTGKERARGQIVKSKTSINAISIKMYTPKKTKEYEQEIQLKMLRWLRANDFPVAVKAPISLSLAFLVASGSYKGKEKSPSHTKRPDVDNLVKSTMDGLNGVLYYDDCYVTELKAVKKYNDINKDQLMISFKYLGDVEL